MIQQDMKKQESNLDAGYIWAPYTIEYGEPTIIKDDDFMREKTFMKVKEWLQHKKNQRMQINGFANRFVSPGVYTIERDLVVSGIPEISDEVLSRYADKPINEALYGKVKLGSLK